MTEKRFEVYKVIGSFREWCIEDNVDGKFVVGSIMSKYGADRLCDKLNALNDENDVLKQQVHYLKIVCRNELDEKTLKQVMGSLGDVE